MLLNKAHLKQEFFKMGIQLAYKTNKMAKKNSSLKE